MVVGARAGATGKQAGLVGYPRPCQKMSTYHSKTRTESPDRHVKINVPHPSPESPKGLFSGLAGGEAKCEQINWREKQLPQMAFEHWKIRNVVVELETTRGHKRNEVRIDRLEERGLETGSGQRPLRGRGVAVGG